MKRFAFVFALICTVAFVSHVLPAFAEATPAEAQAMVDDAIKYYQQNGQEKAFEAFNAKTEPQFHKGDLYVFLYNLQGVCVAHGLNPNLIGKNLNDLKDAKGNLYLQEMHKVAQNGGGWVDYQWMNPETKKIQAKTSYVKLIPGTDIWVGCGIYK